MATINTWNELRAILCNLSVLTDDELHALMNRIAGAGLPCGCSPMDRAMNGEYSAEHNKLVQEAYWALDDEEHTRYQRGYSGSEQPHFGHSALAVDKNVVERNVKQVAER